jgi:sporulation protein YlmC with PRC-barrel domain
VTKEKEKAMSVGEVEDIDFEVDVKNVEQVLDIEDVEIDEAAPDEDEEEERQIIIRPNSRLPPG